MGCTEGGVCVVGEGLETSIQGSRRVGRCRRQTTFETLLSSNSMISNGRSSSL